MSATSPSSAYKHKMSALERRHAFLERRIATYREDGNPSHDKAEKAALDLALGVLRENKDIALAFLSRRNGSAT